MQLALAEASKALAADEVPVGAVIMHQDGRIISQAHNRCHQDHDPTCHAEILAIRQACATMASERLSECDLYVTLEPCAMCAGAIAHARLRRLYFAAYDAKGGAVEHGPCLFQQPTTLHQPEIIAGLCESEAREMLQNFFKTKRRAINDE